MTNGYNDLDEDDVVIEGSDLHKVLIDMGCTDFESVSVNQSNFHDVSNEIDDTEDLSPTTKHEWLYSFIKKVRDYCGLYKPEMKCCHGGAQLEVISKLDPLLDDHSMMIQNMLQKNHSSLKKKYVFHWPIFIASNSILVTTSFLYKPLRIPGLMGISMITAFLAHRAYSELHSINNLKKLISIQNDIYCLFKRTMKILKNGCCLKLSQKHAQRKFSNLDIERVKYLQPMCENFIQSMHKITYTCYQISVFLMNFLNENNVNNNTDSLITKFEDTVFTITGEITYEKLKQHYYIYILVQSEMMQILAILYEDKSIHDRNFHSHLMKIVNILSQLLRVHKVKLNNIIEQYKSSRTSTTRYEMKHRIGTKLQDLYMHVDLLDRKIRSAYNVIESIIDDLDNYKDDDNSNEVIDSILTKMLEVYKQIETARNFAQFNNVLIAKFRENGTFGNHSVLKSSIIQQTATALPIRYDTDPQIIDEVFEEYINDEYLKPLYEDNDIDMLENGKLDKLLVKNFVDELKEVLIEKYKTMSEREAKALLCYQKKIHNAERDNSISMETNADEKLSEIPLPPPLPKSTINQHISQREEMKIRVPVPLPRLKNTTYNHTVQNQQQVDRSLQPTMEQLNKNFFFSMNTDKIKLPAFATDEETFIGSGENSDSEIITDDALENVIFE